MCFGAQLRRGRFLLLSLSSMVAAMAACTSERILESGHAEATRAEVLSADDPDVLLAVWEHDDLWRDASGNPIDELTAAVYTAEGMQPLRLEGAPARVMVRFLGDDGQAVAMTSLARDSTSGEHLCSEFSVRYYPLDDSTTVIAWPNTTHPQGPEQATQFARRKDGVLVPIFHCSTVTIFPEREGAVDIAFVIWHISHSDVETPPIRLQVLSPTGEP